MTAEEEVRAAYKEPVRCEHHSRRVFVVMVGRSGIGKGETKEAAWISASLFLEECKRQIAEIEEEINLVNANWSWANETSSTAESIWHRILTRLQAQLTELKKGMKEQPNGK